MPESLRGSIGSPGTVPLLVSETSSMRCQMLAQMLAGMEPRFHVIACVCAVEDLLRGASSGPSVSIISGDLADGPLTGFQALRRMHAGWPAIRCIMLLDHCESDSVVAAFRGGARGVFFRAGSIEDFVKCIESVHQGQVWAGSMELQFVMEALTRIAPLRAGYPGASGLLTKREQQITKLVGKGMSDREIGRRLNLGEGLMGAWLSRVLAKLNLHSRVELALFALQGERESAAGQKIPEEDRHKAA